MALPTTNLKISDVKNILGESNYNLSDLCTSPNINKWAKYRPGDFTGIDETNGIYPIFLPVGGASSPYVLGDFRGYNHYALAPTHYTNVSSSATIEEFDTYTIQVGLARGERLPIAPLASWDNVKVEFYDDIDSFLGSIVTDIPVNGKYPLSQSYNPTGFGTKVLKVKTFYYTDGYNAMTEEGVQTVSVTVIALQIRATLNNISVNGNDIETDINLIRLASTSKGLYYRLRVMGKNMIGTASVGYYTLTGNQNLNLTNKQVTVTISGTPIAQNASLMLDCSIYSNFSKYTTLKSTLFWWSGAGGNV